MDDVTSDVPVLQVEYSSELLPAWNINVATVWSDTDKRRFFGNVQAAFLFANDKLFQGV